MFIKVLTTALVLLGIALMIAFPFVLGSKPSNPTGTEPANEIRMELAQYGTRVLTYFVTTSVVWIGAAGCAVALVRRTKREFLMSQQENLKELVRRSTHDHEQRQ